MTYKRFHQKWTNAMRREHLIAYSLKRDTPRGVNPTTKKQFRSVRAFTTALRAAEKKKEHYKRLTLKYYKKETGRDW